MGELVGTSTSSYPTISSPQRKSFYAAGRFWVFYCDGNNIVYKTSENGKDWTAAIIIIADVGWWGGLDFSIWLEERGDETFLHYAYSRGTDNTPLLYRRGIPNSDGTITWNPAGVQTAVAGGLGLRYERLCISVDSDGYAWIGYSLTVGFVHTPTITRSSNNDGTWGATGGFPYQPSAVSTIFVVVVPLTGGEVLAVYAGRFIQVKTRLWNGAWGSEVATNTVCQQDSSFSAVAEGNDVHIVFWDGPQYYGSNLVYTKYIYSTNSFSTETILLQNIRRGSPHPVISLASNNDLYVFWLSNPMLDTVYYRKYDAAKATWDNGVKWKVEETSLSGERLTCFYNMYSGYIGIVYNVGTSVKFNYVAPSPPLGVTPAPGEPGSPGAPEPTAEPEVVSNTLTSGGSRHTTPEQGSVGTKLSARRTRISRHITWVPVVIVRA